MAWAPWFRLLLNNRHKWGEKRSRFLLQSPAPSPPGPYPSGNTLYLPNLLNFLNRSWNIVVQAICQKINSRSRKRFRRWVSSSVSDRTGFCHGMRRRWHHVGCSSLSRLSAMSFEIWHLQNWPQGGGVECWSGGDFLKSELCVQALTRSCGEHASSYQHQLQKMSCHLRILRTRFNFLENWTLQSSNNQILMWAAYFIKFKPKTLFVIFVDIIKLQISKTHINYLITPDISS